MGRSKYTYSALALALPLVTACQRANETAAEEAPDQLATLTGVEFFGTRTSPALVRFVLADPDGDAADLELAYTLPNGVVGQATLVPGEFTLPDSSERVRAQVERVGLAAPSEGRVYYRLWDFAADFGTPDLVRGVEVSLRAYSYGAPATPIHAEPEELDLGNDAPTLVAPIVGTDLAPTLAGIADIPLLVRDTSGDPVRVTLEYSVLDGDAGCELFMPARNTNAEEGAPSALDLTTWTGVGDLPDPTIFAWDTLSPSDLEASCSIVDSAHAVRLRIVVEELLESPDDQPARVVFELADLRVDNTPAVEEITGGDDDPDENNPDSDDDSGGDEDPGDEPGDEPDDVPGDEITGDEGSGDDGGIDGTIEAHLRRLAGAHPWLAPFLSDETFRRVILLASAINPDAIAIADIDGDRDLDLLWAHTPTDRVFGFPQIAPETFSPSPLQLAATEATPQPVAIAAADIDGDGDVDVLCARRGGAELVILTQVGFGVFDDEPLVLRTPGPLEVARVRITDLDQDGDADIVAWNPRGAPEAMFFQTRPGVFEYQGARGQ